MDKWIADEMRLAVAYYPEHWDRALWEDDLLRMKQHGISVLRIGDFAWSLYEFREGEFTLGYYDDFLDLCEKHGMRVIFCTPTAAPPMWMIRDYPQVCNCDREGNVYQGPRRHYSYNSSEYRRFCARIVQKLAEQYGRHACIVGWQIDNELNCDLSEFFAEADHAAYRAYLQSKFGTLENLNNCLGLPFWSRRYSDWSQVRLDGKDVGGAVNPHLALEEKRFFSHSAVSFCRMQAEILRKHIASDCFLTTNGLFANLDYQALIKVGLDFITFDSYPNFAYDVGKRLTGLKDRMWSWNLAWTRAVSPIFGIMEQQAGANGWTSRMETPMPKPGQMRLWALQSVAHGADMISFFRWRTSPIGCEIYWHGLNDYDNRPNRRLAEVKRLAEDLRRLQPLRCAVNVAEVAVLKDCDNEWDGGADVWQRRISRQSDDAWFAATQHTHTPCDFFYLNEDTALAALQQYRLLVYPHAAILTESRAALLRAYVEAGGTLVLGARTGLKDEYGRCPMRAMPGWFADWLGATVDEYSLVHPEEPQTVLWNGCALPMPVFAEKLGVLNRDEVLARYRDDEQAPALCAKKAGQGVAYYWGGCFSEESARALLAETGRIAPMRALVELPTEVELTVRANGEKRWLFLLNYASAEQTVRLLHPMTDLLTDQTLRGEEHIEPYGVRVLGEA